MTSQSPARPALGQQAALPPVYRPDQVLTPAAYRDHLENRRSLSQVGRLLVLLMLIGLLYLLVPVLAPLAGELLGDFMSNATQTNGG